MMYTGIFSPITVKTMTVKNRITMMPMGSNMGGQYGEMTEDHICYYEQRAKGGTGLITVENACIDMQGLNGTTQLRIDHDRYITNFGKLTERLHAYGSCVMLQINHAGSGAYPERTGMPCVSSSAVPSKDNGPVPVPMTHEQIYEVVKKFGKAAKRVVAAGFDAVEIHCGHSYLISQFASPIYNKREDEFGGSIENRARFGRLVLEEVRKCVGPNFPISIRITSDDLMEGGNTFADTLKMLEYWDEFVDIYNVSLALSPTLHYQLDTMDMEDGWRTHYARTVKEKFGKPCITMGNIRTPELADKLVTEGTADFIGIGRGLIADPQWVNKVYEGREAQIRKCISCNIGCAGNRLANNRMIRCTINPDLIHDDDYKKLHVKRAANVVVIGGGTAGLEAACSAAEVGCSVFLLEKGNELGGLAQKISTFPEKRRIRQFVDYQKCRADALKNLYIFRNHPGDLETVRSLHPDIVINATGSAPLLPPITGLKENIDSKGGKVMTALYVIEHMEEFLAEDLNGKRVAVVGGGLVGVDAAEFFGRRGAKVQMFELLPEIGRELDPVSRCAFREFVRNNKVELNTEARLKEVRADSFVFDTAAGERECSFDYGLVCMGMASVRPLEDELSRFCLENRLVYANIGDSKKTRTIIDGVEEGRSVIKLLDKIGCFD